MNIGKGQKLAALLVSGWSRRDQRWLLGKLPSRQRHVLKSLIGEIERWPQTPPLMSGEAWIEQGADVVPADTPGNELEPITPLLQSLPAPWAARVLQCWNVSDTQMTQLVTDALQANAVTEAIHQLAQPVPQRLAAAIRELSLRTTDPTSLHQREHSNG